MHNSAALLPELLDDGIRVLIYAGEGSFVSSHLSAKTDLLYYDRTDDAMCNWLGASARESLLEELLMNSWCTGNYRWATELNSTYSLHNSKDLPWSMAEDDKVVGEVRSVGEGAGNFAFVKIFNAGHMVRRRQSRFTPC